MQTRRAAHKDVRGFPPRQGAESENPRRQLNNLLVLPRGKAAFFGYFLCGGKESNPAAQRSEALSCVGPYRPNGGGRRYLFGRLQKELTHLRSVEALSQ